MTMYFSKTTNGFYDDAIHDVLPEDAVEISIETWRAVLDEQSKGKVITADSDGLPITVDAPTPPLKFAAETALNGSDRMVLRCYEHAVAVPAAWVTYRDALRAIVNGGDTTSTALPTEPPYPAGT